MIHSKKYRSKIKFKILIQEKKIWSKIKNPMILIICRPLSVPSRRSLSVENWFFLWWTKSSNLFPKTLNLSNPNLAVFFENSPNFPFLKLLFETPITHEGKILRYTKVAFSINKNGWPSYGTSFRKPLTIICVG